MTAAMVMTVLLAADVLLAQDNPEAVILTEEEFQGDADAQFNLGVMHAAGRGVLKDDAEAVRPGRSRPTGARRRPASRSSPSRTGRCRRCSHGRW